MSWLSWRWGAVWAVLAVVLAGTLAATLGLAANAVPKSWGWVHDDVLLWSLACSLLVVGGVVAAFQAHASSGQAEQVAARPDAVSQPITIESAGPGALTLSPYAHGGAADDKRAGGNLPPRNPIFTGRTGILDEVKHFFESGAVPVMALCGLGGVGKSQVALEYAYRARKAGRYWLVWWVRADSPVTMVEDLVRLAPLVGVTAAGPTGEDQVVKAALDALGTRSDWLMVFDNAERLQSVAGVLPGGDGHVLITTRNRGWSGVARQLDVEEFGRTDSVEFLEKRTGRHERQDAFNLAEVLGDFPLALAQAAAFIENNDMTIGGYLDLYQDPAVGRRLRAVGLDSGEYPRSVAATWLLHFERLEREQPAAADLLRLCSFLDPDDIDLAILRIEGGGAGRMLKRAMADPLERARTVGVLVQANLLTKLGDQRVRIHRLVQAVTRDQLSPSQTRVWVKRVVALITAAFPERPQQPQSWRACASLAPHARAVVGHSANRRRLSRRSVALRARLSSYLDSYFNATAQGLSGFLNPHRQVVSFSGRAAELTALITWCMDTLAAPVMLVTGAGGVGKTRLAMQLTSHMSQMGWRCLDIADGQEAVAVPTLRAVTAGRALLVVDYAEARADLERMLSAVAADKAVGLRVLLLARSAGEWWDRLRAGELPVRALVSGVSPLMLGPAVDPGLSDSEVFSEALQAFSHALGVPVPSLVLVDTPGIGDPPGLPVLVLHTAALVAVANSAREPSHTAALRVDAENVLMEALSHEQRYWAGAARSAGLLGGTDGISMAAVRQIVAAGSLLGAASAAEAQALIGRVPGVGPSARVASWLRELYPPRHDDMDWLGGMQPDRLAEFHVVKELASSPELARACLTGLDARQARRVVLLLARACTDYVAAEGLLAQTMPAVVAVLADPGPPQEELLALANAIPFPMSTFDQATALIPDIETALPGDTGLAQRALWSTVAGLRLSTQGRFAEALAPMQEAVTAYRELANANPKRYRSDVARSLATLAVALSELGRQAEAEHARAEAEKLS